MTGGQLTMGAKDRGAKDRGAKDRGANDRNPYALRDLMGHCYVHFAFLFTLTIVFFCDGRYTCFRSNFCVFTLNEYIQPYYFLY